MWKNIIRYIYASAALGHNIVLAKNELYMVVRREEEEEESIDEAAV